MAALLPRCPFTWSVIIGTTSLCIVLLYMQRQQQLKDQQDNGDVDNDNNETTTKSTTNNNTNKLQGSSSSALLLSTNAKVIFVLGGPGAGKGTQCQLLSQRLTTTTTTAPTNDTPPQQQQQQQQQQWIHLSAGDLLRAELQNPHSNVAPIIRSIMDKGQIVPSHITVQLLEQAMIQHVEAAITTNSNSTTTTITTTTFLIDGFPRSTENVEAWQNNTTTCQIPIAMVLCLQCPEEVLVGRLLQRGLVSGRSDDANLNVIRKRFHTFQQESVPIIDQYYHDKVHYVASDKSVEDVYQEIAALLKAL